MKTQRATNGILAAAAGLLSAAPALAATINVPADHATIQAAIAAAVDGDRVIVAPGTYVEAIDFLGKSIIVRSASNDPADTTIDGSGALHAVTCVSGEGPGTLLTGFTVTGGNANGTGADNSGGGMLTSSSRVRISNCVFKENNAFKGGGLLVGDASYAEIVDCDFIDNTTDNGFGAGLMNQNASMTVTSCRFLGNGAVTKETMTVQGGGLYINGAAEVKVSNCVFSGNVASEGGAIRIFAASPSISNCTLTGNDGVPHGVIFHNGGNGAGAGSTVSNCIIWGNDGPGLNTSGAGTVMTVSSSLIEGGIPRDVTDGGGSIDADPLFVDADGADNLAGTADDDVHLEGCSPAIDAGDAGQLAADLADVDGDDNSDEPAPLDLDRTQRVARSDVDIGAHEAPGLAFDVNADGLVGFFDLQILLISWGDGCP